MGGTKTGNVQSADAASVMLKMKDSKIRILEEQVGKEGRMEGGKLWGDFDADFLIPCRLSCQDYHECL